jgi:hypothetical protein
MITVIWNLRGGKMIAVISNFTVTGAPGKVAASYFRGARVPGPLLSGWVGT